MKTRLVYKNIMKLIDTPPFPPSEIILFNRTETYIATIEKIALEINVLTKSIPPLGYVVNDPCYNVFYINNPHPNFGEFLLSCEGFEKMNVETYPPNIVK